MFKTKVSEMLGIEYPIVGGTMMWISTADFVGAISEAGGLGVLASAMYKTTDDLASAIDRVRELTDKPFAVNINLFPMMSPVDNNEYTDVLLDKKVRIVETSGHSAPVELCERFKQGGLTWIHKCVGVRYALKVQDLGVDMITVVGYENGGATGKLDIGTLALVPRVVDAVRVPVIGGGGVSDGRGFLALMAMGAHGVIMGTRLLATKEAPIHDDLKKALVGASELDTMLVMRSINATHRVWANEAARKCTEVEARGGELHEILNIVAGTNTKRMYDEGDLAAGIISCGQGIGLAHDIPSVKDLFDRMVNEAGKVAGTLAAG